MNYWLMKSEPESYSIDDFAADKTTLWEGIRNYRARNIMRDEMKPGDLFIFYYSMAKPAGAAGIGKIEKLGLPDNSALDKKSEYYDPKASQDKNPWVAPKISFVEKFGRVVPVDELKKDKRLKDMILFKIARLSVQPLTADQFKTIKKLARLAEDGE